MLYSNHKINSSAFEFACEVFLSPLEESITSFILLQLSLVPIKGFHEEYSASEASSSLRNKTKIMGKAPLAAHDKTALRLELIKYAVYCGLGLASITMADVSSCAMGNELLRADANVNKHCQEGSGNGDPTMPCVLPMEQNGVQECKQRHV